MGLTNASIEKAQQIYEKRFRGRKMSPRHAGMLKQVMAKAIQKGEMPIAAAKAFIAERKIVLAPGGKIGSVDNPMKKRKGEKVSEEKKPVDPLTPPTKKEKAEWKKKEEAKLEDSKLIDREMLNATVKELRAAGAKIDVKPDYSDEAVRLAIHRELVSLADGRTDVLSKLPGEETLKLLKAAGCVGIYVDLSNADCAACPDQSACVRDYLGNLKDSFDSVFQKIGDRDLGRAREILSKADEVVSKHKASKAVTATGGHAGSAGVEWVDKKKKEPAPEKDPETRALRGTGPNGKLFPKDREVEGYDASKMLCVFGDEKNPEKPGTLLHAFVQAVIREGSMLMAVFDPIFRKYRGDGLTFKTMKEAVAHLTEAGVACYPEDLPKEILDDLTKEERHEIGLK